MKKDRFSEEKLSALLQRCPSFTSAHCYDVLPSTNDLAKCLAEEGAEEGTVVLAQCQTAGRGRMGRHFYSPDKNGLYMSLVLRPDKDRCDAGLLTSCAAVSVYRAILELTGISVFIKWVNDLYYNNKKLCGILAESQLSPMGEFSYVILGIGINITPPEEGYAEEISGKTISLSELPISAVPDQLALCAAIVKHWFLLYNQLFEKQFLEDYRKQSCVLGKDISYRKAGQQYFARAVSIDEEARLVVLDEKNVEHRLSTGEITMVRPLL